MSSEKKQQDKRLHARNKNSERYDLDALMVVSPELQQYIRPNKLGANSINFSNPKAVKLLNKALLNHYYGIKNWEFPDENLCPPIPGRADYIHHIADVLSESNLGAIPLGNKITCLDIGVGANCIYPIIGVTEYAWRFIGSDSDQKSIASAQHIVNANSVLKNKVELRLQENERSIFHGILGKEDTIDVSICNPPFHASKEAAQEGTIRKIKNLSGKEVKTPELNFSGISNELIYAGGEHRFIQTMVRESKKFSHNCYWFSTLVSKQSNLKEIYKSLKKNEANQIKTIRLATGNKSSRIVAWTFLSSKEQRSWRENRWKNTNEK